MLSRRSRCVVVASVISALGLGLGLGLSACGGDDEIATPVVALYADGGLPLAAVSGRVVLQDGCLLLDGTPVVWPADTTWDAAGAIRFGGGFEAAEPLVVGSYFGGGGGSFSPDVLPGTLEEDDRERLRECQSAVGSQGVVFAWPESG